MVHVLSNLVLKKTLDETVERLTPFFRTVEQQLLLLHSWADTGMLDTSDPNDLNRLLNPLIDHYPQTSSMMVADSVTFSGNSFVGDFDNSAAASNQYLVSTSLIE